MACAIPAVQRIWLASGRPPLHLAAGYTGTERWVQGYDFYPSAPTPPNMTIDPGTGLAEWGPVVHGSGGDIVLTAAMLETGCPYEKAPWWNQPVPNPDR